MPIKELMKYDISRRDFLKLAGALPLSIATTQFIDSLGNQHHQRNVMVIVFDAFSANHMAMHGYPRETTPNLAKWAERAVVYHNHYAGGNYTTPGTASLLTGTLPWTHRAFDLYGKVDAPFVDKNIFTAFQDHYRIAYTHNPVADTLLDQMSSKLDEHVPLGDLLLTTDELISTLFKRDTNTASLSWLRTMKNLEEGFSYSLFLSHILAELREKNISSLRMQFPGGLPSISGDNYFLLEDALGWLGDTVGNLPQPFLGYFHFMPPHGPYKTTRQFFGYFDGDGYLPPYKPLDTFSDERNQAYERMLRKRTNYDDFLLYVDQEFDRFMERMRSNGFLENTWILLTSDHGEMFERGIAGHLTTVLYEPVVRVPLMIFEPGRNSRTDIYSRTNAIDILPTLLHVTSQRQADWSEGIVLPPFAPAQEQDSDMYIVQSRKNDINSPLTTATVALLKEQYKLTYFFGYEELEGKERIELYDLENDPEELVDLSSVKRDTTAELLNEVKQKLAEVNQPYL